MKGNCYKNKRVLMEAIHHLKAEKQREKAIADQFEARRAKNKVSRTRKIQRREERLTSVRPHIFEVLRSVWVSFRLRRAAEEEGGSQARVGSL